MPAAVKNKIRKGQRSEWVAHVALWRKEVRDTTAIKRTNFGERATFKAGGGKSAFSKVAMFPKRRLLEGLSPRWLLLAIKCQELILHLRWQC